MVSTREMATELLQVKEIASKMFKSDDYLIIPTGASGVAPSHPLLMGRSAESLPTGSARAGARSLTRQRGFRYAALHQCSHDRRGVYYP